MGEENKEVTETEVSEEVSVVAEASDGQAVAESL